MDYLENEILQIHQESIRREAYLRQVIRQSGMLLPPFIDRVSTFMGDLLIRLGTRLKERAYTKLTTEEASAPTFLIML
jgi:hypothetical protein